jgi:alpha-1,3-rhamnosyl/mannosyltransferase
VLGHLAAATTVDVLLDARMPQPVGLPPGVRLHELRGPISSRGIAWLQLAVPRWLRRYPGVFHCPFYGLPYRQPVPMVVTIHDLTFEFAPQWQSLERNLAFRRQARWAARTARRIIVHSEHVRSMVLEQYGRYGVSEDRIDVVRFPVDPQFVPEPEGLASSLARLGLSQPYVVALGGAPRRQLGVAVAAWRHALALANLSAQDLPLVVVGTEKPQPEDGIVYTGVLPDREWAAVLAGARAFCYATKYEGYGMPALEAAACATPVVCARVGSLPELLGEAAAWAQAPAPNALGAALASVLTDPDQAREAARAASERVSSLPAWAEVAAPMLQAYEAAHDTQRPEYPRRSR